MCKPSAPPWPGRCDVFLSYSGEETQLHLIQQLNSELCGAGIVTFWDNLGLDHDHDHDHDHELRERAIEQSRISLVMMSKKYTASCGCLDELLKILECKQRFEQLVIPIFIDAGPLKVTDAIANFHDPERLNRWKVAVQRTEQMSGWNLSTLEDTRCESKCIQKIVEEVSQKLTKMCMITGPHLIGLDPRVKKFVSLLGIGSDDVRIVGIYGQAGIGKTTLAKAVHNHISLQFDCSCFLANVKETSEKYGLVYLQEKLLSEILMPKKKKVGNVSLGANVSKENLRSKRALIILDDLDDLEQLNALAAQHYWFGRGSRIIITTRSEGLLHDPKVNERYQTMELNRDESLELFSIHAFGNKLPPKAYLEISIYFSNNARGIPLVLEVLGSLLHGRTWEDWARAWEALRQIPSGDSRLQLKVCIESIGDDRVKNLFLIIACIFFGMDKDLVTSRLDGYNWFSEIRMNELIRRHLLTIDKNELRMHDLLRDVGRRTVQLCLLKGSFGFNTLTSAKDIDVAREKQQILADDLSKCFPMEIGILQLLKAATPDGNWITKSPDELGQLQSVSLLKSLHCGTSRSPSLPWLDISNNKIPLELIRSCFSLEELQANDNPAEELPGAICDLIQPKSLCLNNNNLNQWQGLNSTSFEEAKKNKEVITRSPLLPSLSRCHSALPTDRSDHNKESVEQDKPQSSKMKDDNVEKALNQSIDMKNLPDELKNLPVHLLKCTSYCCLFPNTYEFSKKTMVQLWVAQGFFEHEEGVKMEVSAGEHFDYLIKKKYVLPCRYKDVERFTKYKIVDQMFRSLRDAQQEGCWHVEEAQLGSVSEKIQHLCFISTSVNSTFKILSRFKHLHTVVFHCRVGMKCIPDEFFSNVKQLRSLVLNRSGISEISSSVGDLNYLCYLDVSETPIKYLPQSIDCLGKLQTLKLDQCRNIDGLPRMLSKLANLRHLEFDPIGRLQSMPAKMRNLTNLQTLSAFLVGREYGYRIDELKNLNNLSGSFCIARLENVLSSQEATEASMTNKYIRELELRWTSDVIGQSKAEEEILECLRPNTCLQELRICGYSGLKFASWINSSCLCNVVTVSLDDCRNILVLPSLGRFPRLKKLLMHEFTEVTVLDKDFHGTYGAFPSLKELTIDDMSSLKEWSGVKNDDFPCLSKLVIKWCPKLVDIQWLSSVRSLTYLVISNCSELSSLGNGPLPSLLDILDVFNCPKLKEKYGKFGASNWWQIAHVRSVVFDGRKVVQDNRGTNA